MGLTWTPGNRRNWQQPDDEPYPYPATPAKRVKSMQILLLSASLIFFLLLIASVERNHGCIPGWHKVYDPAITADKSGTASKYVRQPGWVCAP